MSIKRGILSCFTLVLLFAAVLGLASRPLSRTGGEVTPARAAPQNSFSWQVDGEVLTLTEITPAASAYAQEEGDPAAININTADKDTLMSLPGIGRTLAERIIQYRELHGGFSDTEEIMEVKGIGKATYAGIKEYITAERAK